MNNSREHSSASLLARASRGVAWTLVTSIAAMAISLVTQIILGWLLIDRDFGVYAIAVAFADFLRVFRDGGVSLWLARLSQEEFDVWAGPAYWLSLVCSLVTGGVLVACAFPLGQLYGEREITNLILILAITFPLGTYSTIGSPLLQVQLRFGTMATMRLLSALIRYSLVVMLAWWNWGPYSFVVPVPVVMLFEGLFCYGVTRRPLWKSPFAWSQCRHVLGTSGWSMMGSFSTAILRQFDYAIYGLIASAATVGVYFFAYQLTMQLVLLFSESLRRVVLPVFRRVGDDREQQQRGLSLSAAFLGMIAGPAMFALAVVARDLELVLWHGRWASAVDSIQILAFAMPLHLTAFFIEMLAQSRGRFRLWTFGVLARGMGLGVAAAIGGVVGGRTEPARMSAVIAGYIGLSAIAESAILLSQLRLESRPMLIRLSGILTCAAGIAVLWLNYFPALPAISAAARGLLTGATYAATTWLVLALVFRSAAADIATLVIRLRGSR